MNREVREVKCLVTSLLGSARKTLPKREVNTLVTSQKGSEGSEVPSHFPTSQKGSEVPLSKEREIERRIKISPHLSLHRLSSSEYRRRIKSTPRGGWADLTLCRECGRRLRVKPHPNCARCMAETARVMGRWSKAAHFAGVTQ